MTPIYIFQLMAHYLQLLFSIPLVILYQFTMNPVEVSENSTTAQVCVELSGAIPSSPVTLTLDPAPGSASGKLLQYHMLRIDG